MNAVQKLSDDYSTINASDMTTENSLRNITDIIANNSLENGTIPRTASIYDNYSTSLVWFGATCCIIFSIVGTFLNLISVLALVRCKKLRNVTTAFIVNLCAADLIYCAFTMPLMAKLFVDKDWTNGDPMCKLFGLVRFSNGIISIFSVVAVAINRYVLIVHPHIYSTMYSPRNTAISIACLWIIPITFICLSLFKVWGTLIYNPAIGNCGVNDLDGTSPRKLILFVLLIIPVVSFTYCYLRIYFVVKKSVRNVKKRNASRCKYRVADNITERSNEESNLENTDAYVTLKDKKEFRLLRICLVIFIIYMASTVPIVLVKVLRIEGKIPELGTVAYVIHYMSSVINPLIYIAMSEEYRQAYKDLFTAKIC